MASITSIFFSPPDGSHDCQKLLEGLLGCSFKIEVDEGQSRYTAHCVGLEFVWFDNHGLINDLDIPFEDYLYELDFSVDRKAIDATIADSYQQCASKYVFELFKDRLQWRSALVHDFQRLIARFPSPADTDSVPL